MPNDLAGSNTGIARREFGGATSIERRGETAATAAAAQVRAQAEFHYLMALQDPRSWEDVRLQLLKECERPSFAKAAYYHKPIGAGVTGLSIRFAEKALTAMRNTGSDTIVTFDDAEKRIVRQVVTDYENNVTFARDIVVNKVVERRTLRQGQEAIGSRMNSKNEIVYLVAASEDDLLNKEGALISKAMRTNVLRLLPGDIQQQCEARIIAVLQTQDAVDPEGTKTAMLAQFYNELGIKPQQVAEVLGHDFDVPVTPGEFTMLRGLFNAISERETTIADAIAQAKEQRGETVEEKPTTAGTENSGTANKVREKLKKKAAPPATNTTQTDPAATATSAAVAPEPSKSEATTAPETKAAEPEPAATPAATFDPKSTAAKLQNELIDLAEGNIAEAELYLSQATSEKVQKFAVFVESLRETPAYADQVRKFIADERST